MMKIRITATPPGFAPEKIRKQWVGVEIPLPINDLTMENGRWSGTENENGYVVLTSDAINALRAQKKYKAAQYWESIGVLGKALRFGKDYCVLLESLLRSYSSRLAAITPAKQEYTGRYESVYPQEP